MAANIAFIHGGYVKDDEAKNWNADNLLAHIKEGNDATNEDRRARGFPELEILGGIEKAAHDVTGALAGGAQTVNYNTYLLGRNGYFTLNFFTSADQIDSQEEIARDLLAHLSFMPGKSHEDFNGSTDKIAAYLLATLVGGGIAAKKLGLLALARAFVLKFAKIIGVAVIGVVMGIAKFFRGRKAA
jgi:uncharacterized membrane-anchored protein